MRDTSVKEKQILDGSPLGTVGGGLCLKIGHSLSTRMEKTNPDKSSTILLIVMSNNFSKCCLYFKNVHMAPIACIPECEFEIGHDVIGEMNEKKQTVCSKSTSKQASDQHKPLNSMMGSVAPSSGQGEGPGRQSAVIQW